MNLILVERDEVRPSGVATLNGQRARHVATVLQAIPGQPLRIGIVNGPLGSGVVEAVSDREVTLRCAFDADQPPRPRLDLLLALPRPKVLRRLWAQLAALGVGRIILTNAARVERHYFDTHVLTPECYRPLLIEGLQQARDSRLPDVSVHRQFRILVEDDLDTLSPDTVRLVGDPRGTMSVADAARRAGSAQRDDPARADPPRVLLAVGPEGGWDDFELRLLESRGFTRVTMGERTLRVDTACVALLALVTNNLQVTGDK